MAKAEKTLQLNGDPEEFMEKCRIAMRRLGWKMKVDQPRFIRARVKMTFVSWGEDFTVRIVEGNRILLKSAYVMPVLIDLWQRNSDNMRKFMREMQSMNT